MCLCNAVNGFVLLGNKCVCFGTQLIKSDGSGCTESCGVNEYISVDGTTCVTACDSTTEELKDGKCACKPGHHLDLAGGACVLDSCSSVSIAHPYDAEMCACPTGYMISGGDCVTSCPLGEYVHADARGRAMCVPSCPVGTYISGRSCVTSCGANQLVGLDGRTCVSECPANSKTGKTACECQGYIYVNNDVPTCVTDCYDATARPDQVIGLDGKTCVTATPVGSPVTHHTCGVDGFVVLPAAPTANTTSALAAGARCACIG